MVLGSWIILKNLGSNQTIWGGGGDNEKIQIRRVFVSLSTFPQHFSQSMIRATDELQENSNIPPH